MATHSIILLLLILFSIAYIKLATRFNIVDKPNERSSHAVPTIRGGGILFLVASGLFFMTSDGQYPYLVSGVMLIGAVSFLDDLKTLSSKVRLPFQFVAIALVLMQVNLLEMPWWGLLPLLITGVGFVNLYNFMDGINGITGMYSLAVLSGFYMVNREAKVIASDLLVYLVCSIAVFGFYNFRKKARFFAGDVGSISMAVLLFFIGMALLLDLQAPVVVLTVVVYGTDATLTILYRIWRGQAITEPHRMHLYQKLVDLYGVSHLKIAAVYASVQGLVNIAVWKTYKWQLSAQYFLLFGVVLLFVMAYVLLFLVFEKKVLNPQSSIIQNPFPEE